MVRCLTWPFVAAWHIFGFMMCVTLRLFALLLGLGLMILGLTLTMTIAGAPLGIPFAVLGLLLMFRSFF